MDVASEEDEGTTYDLWFWLSIGACVILLSLSAMFSGLTLGLMSIGSMDLDIIIASGTPEDQRMAAKIKPVRKHGNLLLCTLLLGNVAVNSLLSILMAGITSDIAGFLISTIVIVVFGEIIPQAVCSRHPLTVGSRVVWIVKIVLFFVFPIAYPCSKALDWALGDEVYNIYSKGELKKLVQIHASEEGGTLSPFEMNLIHGALDLVNKRVTEVMVPLSEVVMFEVSEQLDEERLSAILAKGHSRLPVYEKERTTIVGLVRIKDLALINPEKGIRVRDIVEQTGLQLQSVSASFSLAEMLQTFKTGSKGHMAVVIDGETQLPIGIVTLEDIVESLLGERIVDETDAISITPAIRQSFGSSINSDPPTEGDALLRRSGGQQQQQPSVVVITKTSAGRSSLSTAPSSTVSITSPKPGQK
eukprot:TRINITY_DN17715_c0_g1_i1.p1 TRINITY_DN17715_c0_g1~~TRINITY_DN17715_c0_g1_i1.p1  ORF type:complete len:439 (-),score=129.85 TRINITY_DN17715_c0_g1_i1:36-1283(-)